MAFAKLFDSKQYGQLLVKIDTNDAGPEVRVFFEPEGLGVCSLAINFEDSDTGWDKAEAAFEAMDEGWAESMVHRALPTEVLERLAQQ